MATYSNILAWKILWTEEPGRLQSTGLQRVGHNRAMEHTGSGILLRLNFPIYKLGLMIPTSCSCRKGKWTWTTKDNLTEYLAQKFSPQVCLKKSTN